MSFERFHFGYPTFQPVDDEMRKTMQAAIDSKSWINGVAYQEFDQETNAFGTAFAWHTDSSLVDGKIHLASSHLPTIFADVVVEFDRSHSLFPQFFTHNPGTTMQGLFEGDWVERAMLDGLDETKDFGIRVVSVDITQQLPFTLAIGPIGSTLHKSATYDGNHKYTARAFYKNWV